MAWLSSRGISTGWVASDGTKTFGPLQPVNRDAMAASMYRLSGKPAFAPPAVSPFLDVAADNQFYKEITWLASKGISTGWMAPDGTKTFGPLLPVNVIDSQDPGRSELGVDGDVDGHFILGHVGRRHDQVLSDEEPRTRPATLTQGTASSATPDSTSWKVSAQSFGAGVPVRVGVADTVAGCVAVCGGDGAVLWGGS